MNGTNELVAVLMGRKDWTNTILALRYLSEFSATPLDATGEEMEMIADSIQDVMDSGKVYVEVPRVPRWAWE